LHFIHLIWRSDVHIEYGCAAPSYCAPQVFEAAFGAKAPHADDGPHFADFTIGCRTLGPLADLWS
jgi:hypothetical protein